MPIPGPVCGPASPLRSCGDSYTYMVLQPLPCMLHDDALVHLNPSLEASNQGCVCVGVSRGRKKPDWMTVQKT